jgi:alginate O-acetyltransferase complex protein AlgI
VVFSSWPFIFVFLPVTLLVYFQLNRARRTVLGKAWLVLASLFFYAYWNWVHLPLILVSIGLNFLLGRRLARWPAGGDLRHKRRWLIAGIAANLLALAYYKYIHFITENLAWLWGVPVQMDPVVLPLAISFFTFTQIVYLVDSHRGETGHYDLLNYALFVTFFPHLIAGPIVQHSQIMPQFNSRWTWLPRESNLVKGVLLFGLGLFKKVAIADVFAGWADAGFDGTGPLDLVGAWVASLSYTFQLYFDFSGYCDMAMGVALLFNIWLPVNFNSPYRATSIQDFWRRWHITLSHFLRDHLYIPLGGNRAGRWRTHLNLVITFALGGLWHGASWMFVIWGLLHGLALVVHRLWGGLGWRMPRALAWGLTFLFVNVAWVFFRAKDWDSARRVLAGMVDFSSLRAVPLADVPTEALAWSGWLGDALLRTMPAQVVAHLPALLMIALAFGILPRPNAIRWATTGVSDARLVVGTLVLVAALVATLASTSSVFLYFNF